MFLIDKKTPSGTSYPILGSPIPRSAILRSHSTSLWNSSRKGVPKIFAYSVFHVPHLLRKSSMIPLGGVLSPQTLPVSRPGGLQEYLVDLRYGTTYGTESAPNMAPSTVPYLILHVAEIVRSIAYCTFCTMYRAGLFPVLFSSVFFDFWFHHVFNKTWLKHCTLRVHARGGMPGAGE